MKTDQEMADWLATDDASDAGVVTWTHPALQALLDTRDALADARDARKTAEQQLAQAIERFRIECDGSWEAVGQVLGITRQGAYARYGKAKSAA